MTREGFSGKEDRSLSPTEQLEKIISAPLTPLNIDTYHDEALLSIIVLTDVIVEKYVEEHPGESALQRKELEDRAFESLGFQLIGDILTIVSEKREEIELIDEFIRQRMQHSPATIVPADDIGRGLLPGEKEGKDLVRFRNQLKTLLYLLMENQIDLNEVTLHQADTAPTMVRKTSYTSVHVPSLNRLILICDEVGNTSYVFDTTQLEGIDSDSLMAYTKDELAEFISKNPQSGAQVFGNSKWLERMQDMLLEDIRSERPIEAGGFTPSNHELDPWKGFYTSPEGKHFGSAHVIARKLRVADNTVWEKVASLPFVRLRRAGHSLVKGYALEDVERAFAHLQAFPKVSGSEAGEWERFVEIEGRHYGTLNAISRKLPEISYPAIRKNISKSDITPIRILDLANHIEDGYPFEEVKALLGDILSRPVVASEGEWRGFSQKVGEYYGTTQTIADKLGIKREIIRNLAEANSLVRSIPMRAEKGRKTTGYAFEDVRRLFEEQERLPKVSREGEWAGFYEKEGEHFSGIDVIASRLGWSTQKVLTLTRKRPSLKSMPVRGKSGQETKAYSLEEVEGYIGRK